MTDLLDAQIALPDCIAARDSMRRYGASQPVEWTFRPGLFPYLPAVAAMEQRASEIAAAQAAEAVWLLEHPPLYTAGTSARPEDLLEPDRLPVFTTGRGGQYTYHGPGQRVAYAIMDLSTRGRDVRCYVNALEEWVIRTLAHFDVRGERRTGRVGVWVRRPYRGPDAEDKIAAIGVRVRRWVAFHGIAVNVAPDLSDYAGIVPCGIRGYGVTSLADLGKPTTLSHFDLVLRKEFEVIFGATSESRSAVVDY